MPPDSSDSVAVGRRMDLASFFCMIARHGPAAVLAVIAGGFLLLVFILYRSVRERRRKATSTAAEGDGTDGSHRGERHDKGIRTEPSPGEPERESGSAAESTDVSSVRWSNVREEADRFASDFKLRHRGAAAAAEKKPPQQSDISTTEHKKTPSGDTEPATATQDSYSRVLAESHAEESKPKPKTEGSVDSPQKRTDKDVTKEVHDDENGRKRKKKKEKKVMKAKVLKDENGTRDEGTETSQQVESHVNFGQTSHLEDSNRHNADVHSYRAKDDKTEEESHRLDNSHHSNVFPPEEEKTHEGGTEKFVDQELVQLTSDQCEQVTICDGDVAKVPAKDKNDLFDEKQLLVDVNDHINAGFLEEKVMIQTQMDPVKEKTPVSGDSVACGATFNSLGAELRSILNSSDNSVKVDHLEGDQSSISSDSKGETSDVNGFPDLSVNLQSPEIVDKEMASSLEKDLATSDFDVTSNEAELKSVDRETALGEGTNLHVPPSHEDQPSDQMVNGEAFAKISDVDEAVECEETPEEHGEQEIPQQHEACSSTSEQELHLPSSQQDQGDEVTSQVWDDGDEHAEEVAGKETSDRLELQFEPNVEKGLGDRQKEVVFTPVTDEAKEMMSITFDLNANPTLNNLNEPGNDDREGDLSPGSYSEAEMSSVDMSTTKSDVKNKEIVASLDKDTGLTADESAVASSQIHLDYDNFGKAAKESTDFNVPTSFKDQPTEQVVKDTVTQETGKKIDFEALVQPDDAKSYDHLDEITAPLTKVEETPLSDLPLICHEQNSDQTSVHLTSERSNSVSMNAASPVAPGVISQPETLTLVQDSSVVTENLHPSIIPGQISSLEQVDIIDDIMSSPGVGVESGISSMTVSPDLPEPANEFCRFVEETVSEAPHSLFADDVAVSIISEATTEMVFCQREFTTFAVNEDTFGHEVEDRYHAALEEFMMQVTANSLSLADESKTDVKGAFEVVEVKEKKEVVRLTKKVEADTGNETEELYEKTEISIMEATMDNNEWITDTNIQVHPWMNLSVQSFAQDITKMDQIPADVSQQSASFTGTDVEPSTEPKQTSVVPVVDENTEVNKKVLAVQPMPQNVNVTFRVHYLTNSLYQMVAVTGNQQELGNWKEYILLEKDKDGHWATVVSLPAESHVEWKFVVVDKGQVCRWEECGNRLLYTGYGDDLTVHKLWGLL